MFWILAVNLFKFAWISESTFEILLLTFVIFVGSFIPLPFIKQVLLSKTSVTTYILFDTGSNNEVNFSPHWIPSAKVSWVVTLSPILRTFVSWVTNLYVLFALSIISSDFTT